jgi:4,5-dihydroxyphthalate decarboxylase
MKLELSLALTRNPRTWPLHDGRVKVDGVDLVITPMHASEMFWRQLRFAEFDMSEMSFSSLMMAKSKGDERFVGVPVFTTRFFFHTRILVRRDAHIESPADLKGKRVGVPEYQQTAALWARGILQHEWGVHSKDMEFWMERLPELSHGGATGFVPPPGVTVHRIPAEKSIGSMMVAGELDATLLYLRNPNLIDRSSEDLWNHPDVKPLFPDAIAEGARYYKKTGLYPINHGMVIKRELAERHPWLVLNLVKAMERANEIANEERMEQAEYHIASGTLSREAGAALAKPMLRHGVAANRHILETAAQMSHEQGLTPRLMKLDEIFAKSTMDR